MSFLAPELVKSWLLDNNTEYFGTIPMDPNVRIGGDSVVRRLWWPMQTHRLLEAFNDVAGKIAARVSVMTMLNDASFIPIEMVG